MTLAAVLRRPNAPQPGFGHNLSRSTDPRAAPRREPTPRRLLAPSASPPRHSGRPGWLARFLSLHRRRPAPVNLPLLSGDPDAPFTPETFPGLPPEICAMLNTPLEDCDPETLRVLVAAFAKTVADAMPPESGMPDVSELFSRLWGSLGAGLDAPWPDSAPPADPDATTTTAMPPAAPPAAPMPSPRRSATPLPIVPVVLRARPLEASSPASAEALPHTPLASAPLSPETPAANSPQAHHAAAAPTPTMPHNASPTQATSRIRGAALPRTRPFQHQINPAARSHRPPHRRRFLPGAAPLHASPSRHWCYAARASPA